MISTLENGAWLINGAELIEDSGNAAEAVAAKTGKSYNICVDGRCIFAAGKEKTW